MQTAKLFKNGWCQVARLPKEYRLDGREVFIKKIGRGLLRNSRIQALTTPLNLACWLGLWALMLLPIAGRAEPRVISDHTFVSAIAPLSEFALRRAKAGTPIPDQEPGVTLQAKLSVPAGNGPFPIIILFPYCGGWPGISTDWPETLNDWGYATLKVFSVVSRPDRDNPCGDGRDRTVGSTDMLFDAVGAIRYLTSIDVIDQERFAVMGWGIGATGALKIVNTQGFARLFSERAAAAVAFYPSCELHSEFLAASLVLIGGQDKQYPALHCEEMKRLAEPGSPEFDLVIFPELGHDFDLINPMPSEIKKDIYRAVKTFLAKYL